MARQNQDLLSSWSDFHVHLASSTAPASTGAHRSCRSGFVSPDVGHLQEASERRQSRSTHRQGMYPLPALDKFCGILDSVVGFVWICAHESWQFVKLHFFLQPSPGDFVWQVICLLNDHGVLLEAGVSAYAACDFPSESSQVLDSNGWTPLHLACEHGQLEAPIAMCHVSAFLAKPIDTRLNICS